MDFFRTYYQKSKILIFCPFDIKLKVKLNRFKNILCILIRMSKRLFHQKSLKILQLDPKKKCGK